MNYEDKKSLPMAVFLRILEFSRNSNDNGSSWIKDTIMSRFRPVNVVIGQSSVRYYSALTGVKQYGIVRYDPGNDSIHVGKSIAGSGFRMFIGKSGTIFVEGSNSYY